eukprot:GHVS01050263.1.p1 GENE.GHVS01050263.1~~GHVS01050263.1.p1  ORF type:complete len:886 (+),score=178.79 GHVS01050263.1:1-2658(+)
MEEGASRVLQLVVTAAALPKQPWRQSRPPHTRTDETSGGGAEGGQEHGDMAGRESGGGRGRRSGGGRCSGGGGRGEVAIRKSLLCVSVVKCSDVVRALVEQSGPKQTMKEKEQARRQSRRRRRMEKISEEGGGNGQNKRTGKNGRRTIGRLRRGDGVIVGNDQPTGEETTYSDLSSVEDDGSDDGMCQIANTFIGSSGGGVLGIRPQYGISLNQQSLLVRGVVNIYTSQVASFCRDTHLLYSRVCSSGAPPRLTAAARPARQHRLSLPSNLIGGGGNSRGRRRSASSLDRAALLANGLEPTGVGESLLLRRMSLPDCSGCWPALLDAAPQTVGSEVGGDGGGEGKMCGGQDFGMFCWEEDESSAVGRTGDNVLAAELERLKALGFTNANIGRPEELQLSPDITNAEGAFLVGAYGGRGNEACTPELDDIDMMPGYEHDKANPYADTPDGVGQSLDDMLAAFSKLPPAPKRKRLSSPVAGGKIRRLDRTIGLAPSRLIHIPKAKLSNASEFGEAPNILKRHHLLSGNASKREAFLCAVAEQRQREVTAPNGGGATTRDGGNTRPQMWWTWKEASAYESRWRRRRPGDGNDQENRCGDNADGQDKFADRQDENEEERYATGVLDFLIDGHRQDIIGFRESGMLNERASRGGRAVGRSKEDTEGQQDENDNRQNLPRRRVAALNNKSRIPKRMRGPTPSQIDGSAVDYIKPVVFLWQEVEELYGRKGKRQLESISGCSTTESSHRSSQSKRTRLICTSSPVSDPIGKPWMYAPYKPGELEVELYESMKTPPSKRYHRRDITNGTSSCLIKLLRRTAMKRCSDAAAHKEDGCSRVGSIGFEELCPIPHASRDTVVHLFADVIRLATHGNLLLNQNGLLGEIEIEVRGVC